MDILDLLNSNNAMMVFGYFVGFKVINVALDHLWSQVRKVIAPKDAEFINKELHALCLQRRDTSETQLLQKINELQMDVKGLKRLIVAFMTTSDKKFNMADFEDLGVF